MAQSVDIDALAYRCISYRNIYINLESPYQEVMRDIVRMWGRRILKYVEVV